MATQFSGKEKAKATSTLVITGVVRWSYLQVWEPKAIKEGDKPKYSVQLVIPKSDKTTIAKITKAYEIAREQGKSTKWNGSIPAQVKLPLRDGDIEKPNDAVLKGCYFMAASSDTQPNVIDIHNNKIFDQTSVYSGCYGRASINLYPYNFNNMNKGVAVGLNNLQFVKDGEPLGGRNTAEYDFSLEPLDDMDLDDDLAG